MKKTIAILLGINLCLLIGCGADTESTATEEQTSVTTEQATTEIEETQNQSTSESVEETTESEEMQNQSTIYIGTGGQFGEYTVISDYADFADSEQASLYLEDLIAEMGLLTGWNLDCDISVYKTVGVAFGEDCTLFVGPPDEQKEEFHMFDAYQLTQTILDSIAKTIQMNLGGENPELIEVYYSTATDEQLTFSNIDMYVPLGESYTGLVLVTETAE